MRVMGFDPVPPREFREYLRVVRGLLRGEEVEYTHRGETRAITLLHRQLGFVDIAHEIPIWVAANGPLALAAAGACGDGRISAGAESSDHLRRSLGAIRDGAMKAGRSLPPDFHTAALTFSCVLRPGEKLTSDRVIDAVGSMASATLHFWWELAEQSGSDRFVPDEARDSWDQYLRYLKTLGITKERMHLRVHEGHCTYLVPEERRFITPEVIRASGGLVGEPDEILAMLKAHEAAGLREVTLLPPMASARELFREFATEVMARWR
jgi:alkanesulfonate monooxygenase SsuD/methylene tetrahydromethanopterin reductase-like flavin-dependent oxidoreductase (luciferase family)